MIKATFPVLVAALLAAGGLVFAQGAGSGSGKKTIGQELRDNAAAGAGYIQADFLSDLGGNLAETFGEQRSQEMLGQLGQAGLGSDDVLGLMNGKTTRSSMQDMFGASRSELPGLETALDGAVGSKDKKAFFGIMVFVMVVEFDVDPDAEFCKQAFGAREEMPDEAFGKLKNGNFSTNTIGEAFGFEHKADAKFMQDILNAVKSSVFVQHPMCASLGMGSGRPLSDDERGQFPQLSEGMPGFPGPGSGFENGMAGGLPFDQEMPPCPFAGGNLGSFFGEGEGEGEGSSG